MHSFSGLFITYPFKQLTSESPQVQNHTLKMISCGHWQKTGQRAQKGQCPYWRGWALGWQGHSYRRPIPRTCWPISVLLTWGQFEPRGHSNVWEMFLAVTSGGMHLVGRGRGAAEHPATQTAPQRRLAWPKMSIVVRLTGPSRHSCHQTSIV